MTDPDRGPADGGHADLRTYLVVAGILTVVTALEFAVLYIRALTPIVVPLLLVMSAGKFALVVLFFMHLRYDTRALWWIFGGALVVATGLVVALTTLSGDFLVYRR
ncbi:MAG: cytochrome C oxidase subunit IV family protein [Candidatus Rokubacteria bacterium]|nr:cytochrome C oxidase subunit IV family protein [Candidatus Rokubacteria bacterium]